MAATQKSLSKFHSHSHSHSHDHDGVGFRSILEKNSMLLEIVSLELSKKLGVLIKENSGARVAAFAKFEAYTRDYVSKISSNIILSQESAAQKLKGVQLDPTSVATKKEILKDLNTIITSIGKYLALVKCCSENVEKGLGACQEHSILSMAFLQTLIGAGDVKLFNIEAMMIMKVGDKNDNHQLLVINRNADSELSDPNTWGEDCIVFDSQHGEYSKITAIPKESSISAIKKYGRESGLEIEVQANSLFNFPSFVAYLKNPLFGEVAKVSYEFLHSFLRKSIVELTKSAGLDDGFMQHIKIQITLKTLTEISGQDGWKAYRKGSVFLLENADNKLIASIAEKLRKTEAFTVKQTKRADTGTPVVQLTDINLNKIPVFCSKQSTEIQKNSYDSCITLN